MDKFLSKNGANISMIEKRQVPMTRIPPPIASLFCVADRNGCNRNYRVTGYYKQIKRPENMDWIEQLLWDSEDLGEDHIMIIACSRQEAEFVSGSGVCGTICRIEDIEVFGMVNWSRKQIKEAQKDYERLLINPHRRFFEPVSLWKYWQADRLKH